MGHIAGSVSIGLSCALGFFWLIDMVFATWQSKGVLGLHYYVGLLRVQVTSSPWSFVAGMVNSDLKKFVEDLTEGTSTVAEIRDTWCATKLLDSVTGGACDVWGWLHVAGWTMGLMGILSVIFFFLGAGFSYYYWQNEARTDPRMWARVSLILAPSTSCFGLLFYTFFTWGFSDWLSSLPIVGTSHMTFSTGFMFAWVLAVLSWLPIILHEVFAGKAWVEQHNEAAAEFRHEQREAAMDAAYGGNYGATPQMGPPMGGPPMQQQGNWGGGYQQY